MPYRLRAVAKEDTEFCRQLYVQSMLPVMASYTGWDSARLEKNFDAYFIVASAQIIEAPVRCGWVQVEEKETESFISFIYLSADARGKGIGTHIISTLMKRAVEVRKTCTIRCVKNNMDALRLYKKLGFRIVSEDNLKYFMEAA